MGTVKENLIPTPHIDSQGNKRYLLPDGKTFHRADGPAVELSNGHKQWFFNGKLHRENGPAVEATNGNKTWYFNGKLHRADGPAVEYSDGDKRHFLNGKEYSFEEWEVAKKMLWVL